MTLDVERLSGDLSAGSPTGESLEFDLAFGLLERAAAGKPEQQFGATIVPAEDPDWKDVREQALGLLERTYDLRVIVELAIAELHLDGMAGFAQALQVIDAWLANRWVEVHPQLDPDDDNDPMARANCLLRLADPTRVLRRLREMPLARSPRGGPIGWRDMALAAGMLEAPEGTTRLTESAVRSIIQETNPADFSATRTALASAAAAVTAINNSFAKAAGAQNAPKLDELVKQLGAMNRLIDRFAPAAAPVAVVEAAAEEGTAEAATSALAAPAASARSLGISAQSLTGVATRADAMRLLDIILEYYRQYEPSSPVPLLLERARRLAEKSFIDVLTDMLPDAVSQAQFFAGIRDQ